MKSLTETLKYKNPQIINKFLICFDVTTEEAEDIFAETLKWLWLCANVKYDHEKKTSGIPKNLNIQSGMIIMDELWHLFILHTRDYADFCNDYFGTFVHHSPGSQEFQPATQSETEQQMSYIYDHLGGADTLKKWYSEFSERYSLDVLKQIRKDPLNYL